MLKNGFWKQSIAEIHPWH